MSTSRRALAALDSASSAFLSPLPRSSLSARRLHTTPSTLAQTRLPLPSSSRRSGETRRNPNSNTSNPRTPTPRQLPTDDLATLLETFATLRAGDKKPNAQAYIELIRAAGDHTAQRRRGPTEGHEVGFEIALAALEDARRGKVELGPAAADLMLRFTSANPSILPSLLLAYRTDDGLTLSAYNRLASNAVTEDNMEQLVVVLHEMFQRDMAPTRNLMARGVKLCCEWGAPRLALELIHEYEDVFPNAPKVDVGAWVHILTSSADNQFLSGVETAWANTVGKDLYTPDEGVILAVLSVAGRWGRTILASQALEALGVLSIRPQEHHLAPLLEAFCNAGQVPSAIEVLGTIRESGIVPTMVTAQPIVSVLSTVDVIDQAFYTLEDMHTSGRPVDVAALNAVIAASANLGDLQRARATQAAAAQLGVTPNADTFNLVLSACVAAQHRPLGDTVLSEMAAAGISPTETTYERMVALCLTPEHDYEDAFYYLEKLKGEGYVPSLVTYSALARKCTAARDPRLKLVVEEMREVGYDVDRNWMEGRGEGRRRVGRDERGKETGLGAFGAQTTGEVAAGRRKAFDAGNGKRRRQWIETGSTRVQADKGKE